MKIRQLLLLVSFILIYSNNFAQEKIFTSRKGSKFFPGHFDIVVTINNENIKYELFNHWYSGSYAELREINIIKSEIEKFNLNSDSLKIEINKNSVRIIDKKYKINKKIKSRKLCTSKENMRKISFAYEIAKKNNLRHFSLYNYEDLKLPEEEFKKKIETNLILIKQKKE